MQLNKRQIQNLLALLKTGKFTVTADEALEIALLKQELEKGLEEIVKAPDETPKSE